MKANYSFVKTEEQLRYVETPRKVGLCGAEQFFLLWEIDEAVYRKLLPPHFEPTVPVVMAYFVNFHQPTHFPPYGEVALILNCAVNGENTIYFLSLFADYDQAILSGRIIQSLPKKLGRIEYRHVGDRYFGYAERNGIRVLSFDATVGAPNAPEAIAFMPAEFRVEDRKKPVPTPGAFHMLKWDSDAGRKENVFHNFRIVRCECVNDVYGVEHARINRLEFEPSVDDPWCELAPKRLLGAFLNDNDNYQTTSSICYEYRPEETQRLMPHIFNGYDGWMFGDVER